MGRRAESANHQMQNEAPQAGSSTDPAPHQSALCLTEARDTVWKQAAPKESRAKPEKDDNAKQTNYDVAGSFHLQGPCANG